MITTLATRIARALALLARRAARIMNCNSMAPDAPQAYLVPQRVAGNRRRQGCARDARGYRT
ncbi:hypothetical protein ABIC03_001631 [Bradyrhizobium sp. RT6a]|jgi:hypothetical protein|uniref:hypothetical protein n=1 Tax=unclassified Bradyrhizobium TaxID=2631580 RepID=UPI00339152F6